MSKDASGTSDLEPEKQVPILQLDEETRKRFDNIMMSFGCRSLTEPTFFVEVPGRVNLIGEHIDYCGYAVCAMAIKRHITIGVVPTTDEIVFANRGSKYENFNCLLNELEYNTKGQLLHPLKWYKYPLWGVQEALEMIPKNCTPTGFTAVVDGNIPPNSGLSSSSALVSAALLLTMHINKQPLPKLKLATASAVAERNVGTQGGGMDQAIAFLGSAQLIEFNPLRCTDIKLPETAGFVIAHSQTYHNNASTDYFNTRVMECQFAALMIGNKRKMPLEKGKILKDVQDFLGASFEEMASIVTTDFHEEPYTLNEICKNLGITKDTLRSLTKYNEPISDTFKLRQRALHVFQEAARVKEFQRVCNDSSMTEEEKIERLGDLMCKSHESLRTLYECSTSELDEVVKKAMSFGAIGAKLTGAGWGGCVVAITTKDKASEFVHNLKMDLSKDRITQGSYSDDVVFATEPSQGAVIYAA